MRSLALILASALVTGVFSLAAAQDVAGVDDPQFTAPSAPEATDAIPDWYQRFSVPEANADNLEWAGVTETDVQFNLLNSRRWRLDLSLTSREGDTGLPREEMWAGASFNVTRRLSIGGSVGVGTDDLGPGAEWSEQEFEAGIRLQSAFKF